MLQVQCLRVRLSPDYADEVIAWMRGLNDRHPEVFEALESEGIVVESLFLQEDGDQRFVLFYVAAPSLEEANAAFMRSTAKVDEEARAMMAKGFAAAEPLQVLAHFDRT